MLVKQTDHLFQDQNVKKATRSSVSGSVNLAVSAAPATQVWWRQGRTSGAPTYCEPSKMLATAFLARNALQHLPWEVHRDFHPLVEIFRNLRGSIHEIWDTYIQLYVNIFSET